MSNSKNKETGSKFKSSFNKSKSISSAMDELEMGKPISKPNLETENPIDTKEDIIFEDTNPNFNESIEDFILDFDMEGNSQKLSMDGVNLEELEANSKSNNTNIENNSEDLKSNSDEDFNNIFISPNDGTIESSLGDIDYTEPKEDELKEEPILKDVSLESDLEKNDESILDDVSLESDLENNLVSDVDNVHSESSFSDKLHESKSSKNSSKSSSKNKIRSIFSSKSNIFAIVGFIFGLLVIIYGILSFANVSERVIDNVLLGEAGSWSIIIILIGLIIILLDVFFFVYYKKTLSRSNITNTQIKSTFDTIDQIKRIDSDYYENEPKLSTSVFKDLLKVDEEESLKDNLNSNFKDEIIVHHDVNDSEESLNASKLANPDDLKDISKEDSDSLNDKENDAFFDKEGL